MNKDEFITKLNDSLQNCSAEEAEKCVEYFCECIYDRMDDGMSEEEAIASMGDVNDLFDRMKSEMPDFFATENSSADFHDAAEGDSEIVITVDGNGREVMTAAKEGGNSEVIAADANGSDANDSDANDSDDSGFYGYGYDGTAYYSNRNNQSDGVKTDDVGKETYFSDMFSVDAGNIQQINVDLKNCMIHLQESSDNNIRISRDGEFDPNKKLFAAIIEDNCLYIQKNRNITKNGVKNSISQILKSFFEADGLFEDVQVTVEIPATYRGGINVKLRGADCTVTNLAITDSRISLQSMSGNISMEGFQSINSRVSFNMMSGDIYVKNSEFSLNDGGNDNRNGLEIHTTSGDVLMNSIHADCKVAVQTVSGDCAIKQWSGIEAMTMKTISGDVRLSEAELGELRINTTSGDVNLNNGTVSALRTETVSGDIQLKLHGIAEDYLIETNTVCGDVNIPAQNFNRQDSIMEPQKVFLKTVSGDIGVEFI